MLTSDTRYIADHSNTLIASRLFGPQRLARIYYGDPVSDDEWPAGFRPRREYD